MKTITAVCSLCGHQYSSWFNEPEMTAHMAEAHGMYFDPRPPPGWVHTDLNQE